MEGVEKVLSTVTNADGKDEDGIDAADAKVITKGKPAAIGTCVESLDSAGNPFIDSQTIYGNFALCHWLYFKGQTNNHHVRLGGTVNTHWGETRIYGYKDWG